VVSWALDLQPFLDYLKEHYRVAMRFDDGTEFPVNNFMEP
jgi:hypothetical protein